MGTRRMLLVAAAVASAAALVGVATAAHRHSLGPAELSRATPSSATSTSGRTVGEVVWTTGPWGNVILAGHRVLVPTGMVDGPLTDRTGVGVGYLPTALGAAIAVLRQPLMVLAAPARMHEQVDEVCVTARARSTGLFDGSRNTTEDWALPPATVAAAAATDARLLGVTVQLDGRFARARVYQAVGGPDAGDVLTASDYALEFGVGQWRIDAVGSTTVVTAAPSEFTLPAPSEG